MSFRYCRKYLGTSESHSVVSDSLRPRGLCSTWNSPGQNSGVGSLYLLQGIFPTKGLNPGLPNCRRILYQLNHKGTRDLHKEGAQYTSDRILERIHRWMDDGGGRVLHLKCTGFTPSVYLRDELHGTLISSHAISFVFFLSCLFIFGCAGSSLLHGLFSSCSEQELLSSCSARASHCDGLCCCGTQALDTQASVAAVPGLRAQAQ